MVDYAKTAADVLAGVGGEENVQSLVHCMTRLRFVLKDESKADAAALRATPGVITTTQAGGQYQVVIGNDVPEVYAAIGRISQIGGTGESAEPEEAKGSLFNRFIKMIAAIFTPVLWALAGTGLLKAFLSAAVTFLWGKGRLAEEFDIQRATRTDLAEGGVPLELTPKKAGQGFTKVFLVVDPATGAVRQSVVVQANGSENRISFVEPKLDAAVNAADFDPAKAFPAGTTRTKAAVPGQR